jgi:hypothetical protein
MGSTGDEQADINVGTTTIATLDITTNWADYDIALPPGTTLNDIRVAFTNDAAAPGYDRNLHVDHIELHGNRYQTEAPTTYSTGTWNATTNCTPGYKQSQTLHCNGHFHYNQPPNTGQREPVEPLDEPGRPELIKDDSRQ